MLRKIPDLTYIVCFSLAWLCLCGFLCGAAEPTVADFTAEGGAGEWTLSLSLDDPALTLTLNGATLPDADPSTPAAVCITVDLPTGWKVGATELAETAPRRLTVTVSTEGARAVILADGELQDLVGMEFLIMYEVVHASEDGTCEPCITAHSDGVAYYDETRRAVVTIPLTGARLTAAARDGEGSTAAESDSVAGTADTADTATGEVTAEPELVLSDAVLVGCQETPCADGGFSVRFIYRIAGREAGQGTLPHVGVVCLVGRGVITAEVTETATVTSWVDGKPVVVAADTEGDGSSFLLVTLRGLSQSGTWVFEAECGGGQRARIRWQDGQFWCVENG